MDAIRASESGCGVEKTAVTTLLDRRQVSKDQGNSMVDTKAQPTYSRTYIPAPLENEVFTL